MQYKFIIDAGMPQNICLALNLSLPKISESLFCITRSPVSGDTEWSKVTRIKVHDLVEKMLQRDPNKRITIQGVINHPFLQEDPEEQFQRALDAKNLSQVLDVIEACITNSDLQKHLNAFAEYDLSELQVGDDDDLRKRLKLAFTHLKTMQLTLASKLCGMWYYAVCGWRDRI